MHLSLEKPSEHLFPSFLKFASEIEAAGETLWDGYYPLASEPADVFITRQLQREINPEPSLVPETVYWAVSEGHVIGRISLRHRIEGRLLLMGGHIGYEVRPTYRRRGFAREMLRLLLLTPKAKSIGHLLLTCSPENVGSNKTIVANGGVLTQTVCVSPEYGLKNHYWITLRATSLHFLRARPEHSEVLSELAFASKSYWNYSEEYLNAAKSLLRISPDFILKNEVWIATAENDEQMILGFFALCLEPDGVLLDHFWVAPKQIGNGVGRKMFQQVIVIANQNQWRRVFLYSDPKAEAFYLKMGAVRIGEKPSRVKCGPMFPVMEFSLRTGGAL